MTARLTATLPREKIARRTFDHLRRIVAIDSHSDEDSQTVPTTVGQLHLREYLARFFQKFNFSVERTPLGSLIVIIPPNLLEGGHDIPALTFSVHIDTSRGTKAMRRLYVVDKWNGERIKLPRRRSLDLSVTTYPALAEYVGQSVIHGSGAAPFGLDDKLGVAELMMLAELLAEDSNILHGEIILVFRPDEEVNGKRVAEELAELLKNRDCQHLITVDGVTPYETGVECFNASRAKVTCMAAQLGLSKARGRKTNFAIQGVKSHGASAYEEGYLNALMVVARALSDLGHREDIVPVDFNTNHDAETDATVSFLLRASTEHQLDQLEAVLSEVLTQTIRPHRARGAALRLVSRTKVAGNGKSEHGGLTGIFDFINGFLVGASAHPILSEDSSGREGYSNPHSLVYQDDQWILLFRLRDFDQATLAEREHNVREYAGRYGFNITIEAQYGNMGPRLAALPSYPPLLSWVDEALLALGHEPRRIPIRGGTGIDPFLEQGIAPINIGTGSWAIESPKELTSLEAMSGTVAWLVNIVQMVAHQTT